MEKGKGIFIAEEMASTKLVSLLRNVEISRGTENGQICGLGDLVGAEADLYKQADAAEDNVYLVDAVELVADEGMTVGLDNFSMKQDDIVRVRKPMSGDRFSISKSVISGDVEVGGKLAAVGAKFEAGEGNFEVVAEWTFGQRAIPMVRIVVL